MPTRPLLEKIASPHWPLRTAAMMCSTMAASTSATPMKMAQTRMGLMAAVSSTVVGAPGQLLMGLPDMPRAS